MSLSGVLVARIVSLGAIELGVLYLKAISRLDSLLPLNKYSNTDDCDANTLLHLVVCMCGWVDLVLFTIICGGGVTGFTASTIVGRAIPKTTSVI